MGVEFIPELEPVGVTLFHRYGYEGTVAEIVKAEAEYSYLRELLAPSVWSTAAGFYLLVNAESSPQTVYVGGSGLLLERAEQQLKNRAKEDATDYTHALIATHPSLRSGEAFRLEGHVMRSLKEGLEAGIEVISENAPALHDNMDVPPRGIRVALLPIVSARLSALLGSPVEIPVLLEYA